jgi:hypothetical protein
MFLGTVSCRNESVKRRCVEEGHLAQVELDLCHFVSFHMSQVILEDRNGMHVQFAKQGDRGRALTQLDTHR